MGGSDKLNSHYFLLMNFFYHFRYYKVHNGKATENTIDPHLVRINGSSHVNGPWAGVEELLLSRDHFGDEDVDEADKLKVEIHLVDNRECHSSIRIQYLGLSNKDQEKEEIAVQSSHWIPVSGNLVFSLNSLLIPSWYPLIHRQVS